MEYVKFIHDVTHDANSPHNAQDLIMLENNKIISIDQDKVMMFQSIEHFNNSTQLPEPDHIIWQDFKTVKSTPKTIIPTSKITPIQLGNVLRMMGDLRDADNGETLMEAWWYDSLRFKLSASDIPNHILAFQRQDPDACVVCEYIAMFHDYLDVIK